MLILEEWRGIVPSRTGEAAQILKGFEGSQEISNAFPSTVFGKRTTIVYMVADADHKYNIGRNADASTPSKNRTILAGQYRLEGVVRGWNLAVE